MSQQIIQKEREGPHIVMPIEPVLPLEQYACFDSPKYTPSAVNYAGRVAFQIGPLRYIHHAP